MLDAYAIGVRLTLDDGILGSLGNLSDRFGAIDTLIQNINARLTETVGIVGQLGGGVRGMATQFQAAATAAERIQRAMSKTSFGGPPSGGDGGYYGGGNIAPSASLPSPGGGYGVPAIIPGQDRSDYYQGWGFSGDTGYSGYLPQSPGVSGPGTALGPANYQPNFSMPPPGGGGGDAPFDDGRPSPIPLYQNSGGNGGGGHGVPWNEIFFGTAVLDGAGRLATAGFNANAEPTHIVTQMRGMNARFSNADAKKAMDAAYAMQREYPGLTLTGATTMIRDSYQQSNNINTSAAMAGVLGTSAFILQSIGDADAENAIYQTIRAGEIKGLLNKKNQDGSPDLTAFVAFIKQQTELAQRSGGQIDPSTALRILRNAGPEGIQMNNSSMAMAELLSQSLGADKVGTGINALAMQFIGGKMSNGAAALLEKAGLVDKRYAHKVGIGQMLIGPGGIKDQALFAEDPFAWIQQDFLPAAGGLSQGNQTKLMNAIYAQMSRIPGARIAAETIFQQAYLERQMGFLNDTTSSAAQVANLKNDPTTVAKGFSAAMNALLSSLTSPLMGPAIKSIAGLTGAMNSLQQYANNHPMRGLGIDATVGTGLLASVATLAAKWLPDSAATRALSVVGGATGVGALLLASIEGAVIAGDADNQLRARLKQHPHSYWPVMPWQYNGGDGSASNPLHVIVTNGVPLVSSSPSMPNGPTPVNKSKTPPMPGQVNRLSGH